MSFSLPKKTTTLGKVRLLLWKNFLLQKHHYLQTFFDICLPVIFFSSFVLLYAYSARPSFDKHHEQKYLSESIDSLDDFWIEISLNGIQIEHTLVFTPNNAIFKTLADQVSKRLKLNDPIGVDDGKQLQDTVVIDNCIAGIEFHHSNDTTFMPKNLAYSIRFPAEMRTSNSMRNHWKTNLLYLIDDHLTQFKKIRKQSYHNEGFLTIQNAIAKEFLKIQSNSSQEIGSIQTQKFPSPERYTPDVLAQALREMTPFFFVVVLCFVFMNTVRFVSVEKEKQLKEAMKIMGLSSWMHYLGWFIRTLFMLSISMAFICILLTVPCFGAPSAIFPRTSFFGLFIFCFGYCISLIAFSFMICAFFANSKSAVTAAMALWFVTSVPYIMFDEDNFSATIKAMMCIFPNTALSYGLQMIDDWELMEEGLNWSTAFREQNLTIYSELTIAKIFALFMIYAMLFFLITVYMENVMPGAYGVAKPWYFMFTKKFWLNSNTYQVFDEQNFNEFDLIQSSVGRANFESEPNNRSIGIEARNLTKKFVNDTAVVSNLNLNVYYDQITCLLGHNGAGKTTIISMLTGMLEPTSGTALINGYDIRKDMDLARTSIGFCPQHNILFDELTVREHILFYCGLKGLSNTEAEYEVEKYIKTMDLKGKENAMSSTLSGGMKRKLSVVIALCGKSKVVFLDEPTSGMDPGARRSLWDILLAEKKDRTIILTTHFMDEADVLSDRIAILADGELKCAGSTFFLKRHFGTGHHLICAKERNCDSQLVTELLQKYIPEIQIESENDNELSYALPDGRNQLFADMLEKLESMELQLNLSGFGISLTTIEEVFLKLGNSESSTLANRSANHLSDTKITLNDNQDLLHGTSLWKNQAIALFRKRYLCWWRVFSSFFFYSIFVIFMVGLLTFRFGGLISKAEKMPALNINLDKYKSPTIVLQTSESKITAQYEQNVIESSANLRKVQQDMETALLELAKKSAKDYKFHYVTALSVENQSITAWYNDPFVHSAPLTLNLAHNAVIQSTLGKSYSIQLTNDPLEYRPEPLGDNTDIWQIIVESAFEFLFPVIIYIIMSILSAKYTSFYIEEKQSNAKFLQYVSGANVPIFWTVSILWDWITSAIVVFLIILILAFGQQKQFNTFHELAVIAMILLIYNFAMMPVICLWSLIFTKPSFGRTFVSIFNVIIAPSLYLAFVIIIWILHYENFLGSMSVAPDVRSFFLWPYPPISMFNALITYELFRHRITLTESIFTRDRHGIGMDLAAMILTGITAYIILIAIEMGTFRSIKLCLMKYFKQLYRNDDDNGDDNDDDDVLAEKMRIQQMTRDELKSEAIVMKNASKKYNGFYAVENVSLSIKRAECFGLLGKNGAGKTTIFKMLTGETMPTRGEIFINGLDQKYNLPEIYQITGYCPQFDALLSGLTCRETLEIFAMLRGIPATNVKEYAEIHARNLDFIQHIDKKVNHLSGGNKRKLSAGLAIIGNINVIFLDEPTTGLDPATKRNLWNVINELRKASKSIILTSHSMEECEALCTQITVLVNGKCKCLGSPQHLKNKFCKGFEMKIKVQQHKNTDDVNDDESFETNLSKVKNFISNTFDGAIFRDEYQGVITYLIPVQNVKWSNVFSEMEKAKKIYQIEDYSISQNSLEQVVLKLLKDQTEQTEPIYHMNEFSYEEERSSY